MDFGESGLQGHQAETCSVSAEASVYVSGVSDSCHASFLVKYKEGSYMVYASSGNLKCFECGDVSHKCVACPHRQHRAETVWSGAGTSVPGVAAAGVSVFRPADGVHGSEVSV